MSAIVAAEHLSKSYGSVQAVREASFAFAAGETVALVGHNGAGKSTLIKLMLGLVRPTGGSLRVLGEDPGAGVLEARSRLGYLPESVSFNALLTGREILSFYARLKRAPVARALELLDRVGLTAVSDRPLRTYSKGMRQRLGLAQALIGEPRLLLLDEPTSGLDPALRLEFYDIVEELRRGGATVVLSSHALAEIGERTRRVVIVSNGVVVADGSIEELRRLARLPAKVRVLVGPGERRQLSGLAAALPSCREINGSVIEFEAAAEERIELVRRVTAAGSAAQDISVVPPTLDDLYAHFLRAERQP